MRNRVFWNSPHTRLFSCLTLLGSMSLVLAGCGGGGGGGGPVVITPPPPASNVSITGTVKDTAVGHSPVVNALVTIVGTGLTTHTDAKGNFSFVSVPATATRFKIGNPDTVNYFSYANFGGRIYDIINCSFALPPLHTGTNAIAEVDLYIGLSSPPPPPPSGCP